MVLFSLPGVHENDALPNVQSTIKVGQLSLLLVRSPNINVPRLKGKQVHRHVNAGQHYQIPRSDKRWTLGLRCTEVCTSV